MNYPYRQYMYSYPHKTAYHTLEGIRLSDYISRLSGEKNSLYFHIPFCQYKCGYCNLFSEAGSSQIRIKAYLDAMERHAGQIADILPRDAQFTDLTLGGGTPLLLSESQLHRVFSIADKYFQFEPGEHFVTVETSPNQTTEAKLSILQDEGVDRISIGVQSFQEKELERLNRLHSAKSAHQALCAIRKKKFACLNIDIIYGIPGQTTESLSDSLRQAIAYEPEEIFVYPLYIKPETILYQQGTEQSPDTLLLYRQAKDILQLAGYRQYSMRRFVKTDRVDYVSCGFGSTLSVGCGGRSYLGNLHFCAPYAVKRKQCQSILTEYIDRKDYLEITHGYLLSDEQMKRRYVIRHILFGRGIDREEYQKRFDSIPERDFPQLEEWACSGYVSLGNEYVSMTDEGFALSDFLGPKLIADGREMGWETE